MHVQLGEDHKDEHKHDPEHNLSSFSSHRCIALQACELPSPLFALFCSDWNLMKQHEGELMRCCRMPWHLLLGLLQHVNLCTLAVTHQKSCARQEGWQSWGIFKNMHALCFRMQALLLRDKQTFSSKSIWNMSVFLDEVIQNYCNIRDCIITFMYIHPRSWVGCGQ